MMTGLRRRIADFNERLAVTVTNAVGTMWCAYAFAALALVSLPAAVHQGIAATVTWFAQTFLQLVLLAVILVGQRVGSGLIDQLIQAISSSTSEDLTLDRVDHELLVDLAAHIRTMNAVAMATDVPPSREDPTP